MKNTILIVDDVEINRELLEDTLKDSYKTISVESGIEALTVEDKRNAFELGMNGFVAKPIDIKELMITLADILR